MPQIDYSIKSLSEYSSDELVTLQLALSIAREQVKKTETLDLISAQGKADQLTVLNTWGYRVRDAIKESQERESELPY